MPFYRISQGWYPVGIAQTQFRKGDIFMKEYATYREMPNLLERREEFRGNNVRAFKDWEDNYIVMSYK